MLYCYLKYLLFQLLAVLWILEQIDFFAKVRNCVNEALLHWMSNLVK